ncbi:MAG: U32 family peptidase [Clostridiales bacterium]|jgi:putative protease|nr:U32 family peptidase [Clostridiales bacterium]
MPSKLPELLAPVKDFSCLKVAILSGADAVYFGGKRFSARARATNFSDDELLRAIDYCQSNGVKPYIAMNTLMTDRELTDFFTQVQNVHNAAAAAIIVQDIGAMQFLHKYAPQVVVHASTQAGAKTIDDIKTLHALGCKRIVLARELSAKSIAEITNFAHGLGVEIEIFIHGAMCASVSGECLMSSFIGDRSANRGMCAQPCRMLYKCRDDAVEQDKASCLLNMKDLSLIDYIPQLINMGVDSLKIEGRMKGEHYIHTVVSQYRAALDGKIYDKHKLYSAFDRGGYSADYFLDSIKNDKHNRFATSKPKNQFANQGNFELDNNDRLIENAGNKQKNDEVKIEYYPPKKRKAKSNNPQLIVQAVTKEQAKIASKYGLQVVTPPKTLNIFNTQWLMAQKYLQQSGLAKTGDEGESRVDINTITLSPELNSSQMADIIKVVPVDCIVYGRLPLMHLVDNPYQNSLIDRTGAEFPIIGDFLYNSVPIYMADKWRDICTIGLTAARLVFTTENADEAERVIKLYMAAQNGAPPDDVSVKVFGKKFSRGKF